MHRILVILLLSITSTAFASPQQKQISVLTEAAPEAGGFSAARLARLDSGMSD